MSALNCRYILFSSSIYKNLNRKFNLFMTGFEKKFLDYYFICFTYFDEIIIKNTISIALFKLYLTIWACNKMIHVTRLKM